MSGWIVFLKRIVRPCLRLVTNVRFFLYFFLAICVFGALGAWIPAAQIWLGSEFIVPLDVHRNLATYVIGIAVTALADCIVRQREDDDGAFRLFLLGLTFGAVVCAIVVLLINNLSFIKIHSTIGAVIAGGVWLLVNDAHPDLVASIRIRYRRRRRML